MFTFLSGFACGAVFVALFVALLYFLFGMAVRPPRGG